MKIGMFDSGMGGLTLLNKAIKILPRKDYVFYADINNLPYGTKTKDEITGYARNALRFLISEGCNAVVIACNTATSVAIETLREEFSLPILGIEPAVKPAVTHEGHKRVLVMATPVTVSQARLHLLIRTLDAENDVDLLPMPELVVFAEREQFGTPAVKEYIESQLCGRSLEDYSDLVLGCTHFNYFKDTFAEIFPDTTRIIDGSSGTIRHLKDILIKNGISCDDGGGHIDYRITGGERPGTEFEQKAQRCLARLDKMAEITVGQNTDGK